MSKFLHTIGTAFVYKDITGNDDVYLTSVVTFDPAVSTGDFIALADAFSTLIWGVHWNELGPFWEEEYDTLDNNITPTATDLGTFQTLEAHYQKGLLTEAWVDGNALWSSGEPNNISPSFAQFGSSGSGGITWVDSVKIGTTRGGSDILFDDFESGTFAAWDGTSGSVSIVDSVGTSAVTNSEVSVAFSSTTLAAIPSWIDLADPDGVHPVSAWRVDRGRASEFDKTVTGTASVDFIDKVGLLDPTNASGPYFGEIDPMKQVRIRLRNPISGIWSHIFKGFASEWQYDVDIGGKFTKTTLEAADAFDLLAALEMTPGHHGDTAPAQSEGEIFFEQGPPGMITLAGPSRIHKALDDAGWPDGPREVFTGNVLLQASVYERLDQLLSVLFDAADAEFPGVANVFISKSGYVTFHGRFTRFDPTNPDYNISTWQVGDASVATSDATVAPISGLSYRRSKADLINVSVCTPQLPGQSGEFTPAEIATMTVKDDTSIGKYGWRSAHYENLLTYKGRAAVGDPFDVSAVDEVKLFSEWIVNNYKDPRTRVERLVFRVRDPADFSGPAIWDLLCGVEIGDIVQLQTSHPGGGGFDEDFFVEGIHYEAQPLRLDFPDITLTLDVSPKSLYDFNPFA